jgi:hypothetical protein
MVHPLRRLRSWLYVKTWDRAHVSLPVEETDPEKAADHYRETELRGQLTRNGTTPELVEQYIDLDRKIRKGEIDATTAMTAFMFGVDTGIDFDSFWKCKKETEEKRFEHNQKVWENFVSSQAERMAKLGDLERTPHFPRHEEYVFPTDPKEHTPLAPKSAMLKPPKLDRAEEKAVRYVEDAKLIAPLVEGFTVPKLKAKLAKKLKESKAGYQRVAIDEKGKIKKVKTA